MNVGLELIIGAVLPPIIDLINKYIKQSLMRYVISLIVCLVVGILFNLDKLNVADILGSGAIVFAAAQTIYKTYWKESDVRARLYGSEINR